MPSGADPSGFLNPATPPREPRAYLPWAIAGIVIALIVAVILLTSQNPGPPPNPGGAALAPPAPYAPYLAISNLHMSQSSSYLGATQTYIDGDIANRGDKTLTGITVQVAFHDFTGQIGQKNTMPLSLIRTHQPYVESEPVSAAPIAPGQTREFRLIFESIPGEWNQQYPDIRVIAVQTK